MKQDPSWLKMEWFYINDIDILRAVVMFVLLGVLLLLTAIYYFWNKIQCTFFGENLKPKVKKRKRRARKRSKKDLDGERSGPGTANGQ